MISLLIGIGVSLLMAGYNYAVNRSAMKKAAREKNETVFDQPDVPVVDEKSTIPVIFGTVKLTGPNVVWWYREPDQSKKNTRFQSGSNTGYDYYNYQIGLHLVFCHGPVDGIEAIYRGENERFSWVQDIDTHVPVHTIVPQGSGARGSIHEVPMRLYFGRDDHPQDPYLAVRLPTPMNLITYRGVFSVVFGSAEYDKTTWRGHLPIKRGEELPPISAVVWRGPKMPNGGANPSWIIEDILTNKDWGRGYEPSQIDRGSFDKAAAWLDSEGFGLCFVITDQTPADEMIDEINRHIDGAVQVDRRTGKIRLRLIREYNTQPIGYEPDPSPVELDDTNITEPPVFLRPSSGEMPTVQAVTFRRRGRGIGDQDGTGWWGEEADVLSIFAHDTAGAVARGKVDAPPLDYPGIPNSELAARVAQRDLRANSTPRASIELSVTGPAGQNIYAGDTIKVTYPKYGIDGVVFRVTSSDIGTLTDGTVQIQAVEDVFSFDRPSIVPQDPPPLSPALPTAHQAGFEMPYWMRTRSLPEIERVQDFEDFKVALAAEKPSGMLDFVLYADDVPGLAGPFSPMITTTGVLTDSYGLVYGNQPSDSEVGWAGDFDFDPVSDPGSVWLVSSINGQEIVKMNYFSESSQTIGIYRGMLDTIPIFHPAGAKMYRIADASWYTELATKNTTSASVELKAASRTMMGVQLDPLDAPAYLLYTYDRAMRPLPPALMSASVLGSSTRVAWRYRDVLSTPKRQDDIADDYRADVKDIYYILTISGRDSLGDFREFRTVTIDTPEGDPAQEFIYTYPMESADSGLPLGVLSSTLLFSIVTVEDGVHSFENRFQIYR